MIRFEDLFGRLWRRQRRVFHLQHRHRFEERGRTEKVGSSIKRSIAVRAVSRGHVAAQPPLWRHFGIGLASNRKITLDAAQRCFLPLRTRRDDMNLEAIRLQIEPVFRRGVPVLT
jgi:hypothetical protein